MLKVKLFVHELELGYLTEVAEGYVFSTNKTNIAIAKKQYPIEMRRYNLPEANMALYNYIPPIYDEFLVYASREDLKERAGIEPYDSDLEILYKMASLEMHDMVFDIKQG